MQSIEQEFTLTNHNSYSIKQEESNQDLIDFDKYFPKLMSEIKELR